MQTAFTTMRNVGWNKPTLITLTPQNRRNTVVVQAKTASYKPPSSTTGATELDALERYSEVSMPLIHGNQSVLAP